MAELQRHTSSRSISDNDLVNEALSQSADNQQANTSALRERYVSFDEFTLLPGDFDIIMIVDNSETTSAARSGCHLVPTLLNAGFRAGDYEVRKLSVGDFLWVARERTANSGVVTTTTAGRQPPVARKNKDPPRRELVLDYIVERKRLDDLSASICDRRFQEQKSRLAECGLRRPIYLIEHYALQHGRGVSPAQLRQAIIDTQVIEGFTIKETGSLPSTAEYLFRMTRALRRLYLGKRLVSCYLAERLELHHADLDEDNEHVRLLTFDELHVASRKNKSWTIRELFLKHLVQIRGMSDERASAVVKRYPTPAHLAAAYRQCANDDERRDMLSNLKFGLQQRKVGKTLSLIVYRLFNQRSGMN